MPGTLAAPIGGAYDRLPDSPKASDAHSQACQCMACPGAAGMSAIGLGTVIDEIVVSGLEKGPSRSHPSLRGAIDAKCRECIYDQKSGLGSWREQVAACTSTTCPLFGVRPRSRGVS